jgi:hypothetical protein
MPATSSTQPISQRISGQIKDRTSQFTKDFDTLLNNFNQSAGPARTFESIGAKDTLTSAIRGAPGNENITKARELLDSSYKGPTELDQAEVAKIKEAARSLSQYANQLDTYPGAQVAVGESARGLTPGERAFEAKRLLQDSEYLQESRKAANEASELTAGFQTQEEAAKSLGKARQEQEKAIADQSRQFLETERSAVNRAIQEEMNEKAEEERRIQELYDSFKLDGDLQKLKDLDAVADLLSYENEAVTADVLDTPERRASAEAQAKFDEIISKYDDIKNIAPLGIMANKRGREKLMFDLPDDNLAPMEIWHAVKRKLITPAQFERLKQRQAELDTFFSPGSKKTEKGIYADYKPLYHRTPLKGVGDTLEDFTPQDLRSFVALSLGTSPSRENVSTNEQRNVFNKINMILDEVDRIGDAEPFRAAMVAVDTGRYLDQEKAELEARKDTLSKREKEWLSFVNKARKRYKKSMHAKSWGDVAGLFSGHDLVNDAVGTDFRFDEQMAGQGGTTLFG